MKKTNKNFEFLYNNISKESFLSCVKKIRSDFKIPSDGFKKSEGLMKWMIRNVEQMMKEYPDELPLGVPDYLAKLNSEILKLIEEHKFPSYFFDALRYFIWFNSIEQFEKKYYPFGCILINDGLHALPSDKFVMAKIFDHWPIILLHPLASQRDVIEFIKKEWGNVKEITGKTKRIRKTMYKERDTLIYKKHLEGKNEIIIARELFGEGGVSVDSDHVRKIIHTEKSRRKK